MLQFLPDSIVMLILVFFIVNYIKNGCKMHQLKITETKWRKQASTNNPATTDVNSQDVK